MKVLHYTGAYPPRLLLVVLVCTNVNSPSVKGQYSNFAYSVAAGMCPLNG